MNLEQILSLIVNIVLVAFILVDISAEINKREEYGNDERWNMVIQKKNSIVLFYFYLMTSIILLAYVSVLIFDLNVKVSLDKVLQIASFVIFLMYPVDYLSLRYYDKRL
ncbi:MAG: hypothetical protein LBV19_10600 [Streptococcaceae bacterium]|jgi:hypothetical protein|nr:hypothetical protein [Streptococcaceae bacterium]